MIEIGPIQNRLLWRMIRDNGWWLGVITSHSNWPTLVRAKPLEDLKEFQDGFEGYIREDPNKSKGRSSKDYDVYIWRPDKKDLEQILQALYERLNKSDPYNRKFRVYEALCAIMKVKESIDD